MLEKRKNKIDDLKRRLYGKEFKEKPKPIGEFKKKKYRVKEEWMSEEPPMSTRKKIKLTKRSMNVKKVLIASIVFFIIAVGLAFFIIHNGSNVFSLKNVDINISGPVSVKGGEEFTLNLSITNRNDNAMEYADLITEYPNGTYASFNSQKELSRTRESFGKIGPNKTVNKTISLVLFGKENTKKEIKFTLESRFEGSNAILDKTEPYDILLISSPVNLSVGVPEKTGTKQEFETIINLESNSSNTLKNLSLNINYPRGFTFISANPAPTQGKNIWKIGDMLPAGKRVIKVRGFIEGQEDAEKIFTVSVGSQDLKNESNISTVYNSDSEQIIISKPFLGLNVLINGTKTPEYILKDNRTIRFDVLWVSNSSTKITDGDIEVKLDGNIANKFSVIPDRGGFYKSLNHTIEWNSRTGENDLSVIEPGESGKVSFTLQALPLPSKGDAVFKNPELNVTVKANGNQTTDMNIPNKLSSSVSKKIKEESSLDVTPRAVYYSGPFKNTGPLPPKVNEETTYTIIFSVTNTSNKVSSTIVKTTLPTYVRWLGMVSPSKEDLSFNELDGEVIWNVGDVDAGTGSVNGAREVAFKVALTPSVSQSNRMPLLTGGITISGKDTFTGTMLESIKKGLDTNLFSDPSFSINQASVR